MRLIRIGSYLVNPERLSWVQEIRGEDGRIEYAAQFGDAVLHFVGEDAEAFGRFLAGGSCEVIEPTPTDKTPKGYIKPRRPGSTPPLGEVSQGEHPA